MNVVAFRKYVRDREILKGYASDKETLHFLWTKDDRLVRAFEIFIKTLRFQSSLPCKKDLHEYIRRFASKVENIKLCLKKVTQDNTESGVFDLLDAAKFDVSVLWPRERDESAVRSRAYEPLWETSILNSEFGLPELVKYKTTLE